MSIKKRKQIIFDVHPELHKHIKTSAAKQSISMNLLIIRAIYQALKLPINENKTIA